MASLAGLGEISQTVGDVVLHDHSSISMIHWYWLSSTTCKTSPNCFNYVQKTVLHDHFCSCIFYYLCVLSMYSLVTSAAGIAWGSLLMSRFSTQCVN